MPRFLIALPLLLPALCAQEAHDAWIQDFAKAKAQAKAEKKDLLIDFTGSDWCGWCIKLDKEVFTQEAFTKAAPKSFVLVKLDFPQNESLVTPEIKAQNEKLGQQYGIQGYPTILLTDADGNVYAQTGYEKGGPEKYVEMLDGMKKKGEVFQAAMLRASQKQGADRALALDEALGALDAEVVGNHHLATMQEILKLDADGKSKLKEKYEGRVQELAVAKEVQSELEEMNKLVMPMMRAKEAEKALAKLDEIVKAPKSKAQHQVALYFHAMIGMNTKGDAKAAIALLEEAEKLIPKSPLAEQITMILPQLQKELEKQPKEGGKDEPKKEGGK